MHSQETSTAQGDRKTYRRAIVAIVVIALAANILGIAITAYVVQRGRIVTRVEYREPACVSFAMEGSRCGGWVSCECPGGTLRTQGAVVICECHR